jgi:ribonuclease HII
VRVLGIDEAGRGCVLGDLFVAGFLYTGDDPGALHAAGARDSKTLSASRRRSVRETLAALGTAHVVRIPPVAIDAGNLNALEEAAIAGLIVTFRPDLAILDALGPPSGTDRVIARLRKLIAPLDPEIRIEPKADRNHPVCGAASIFAKTARDAALAEIDAAHGPLGSGYPSDPVTRAWLEAHAATGDPWPDFVRTRWGTITSLAAG